MPACCTSMAMSCAAPSASCSSCMARSPQVSFSAAWKSAGSGVDAGRTAAHQDHRVVGRHAAVAVHPVEAEPAGLGELIMEPGLVDDGVGGDHHEHGGQAGRQHPRTLGHPADRPALVVATGLLGHGVGGHDRLRGCLTAVGDSSLGTRSSMPAAILSIGSRRPIRPVEQTATSMAPMPSASADELGGPMGVGEAVRAGAGVGAAGVQDHRLQPAVGQHLLGPEHRGGLDPVAW